MYRQCTTEKTSNQQKLFQNALFSAMQEHAYQDITITGLCEQTGLTRNIFYRLFECKDDVLYALIDQYFFQCSHSVASDNFKENLLSFFSFWKEQKNFLKTLDKNNLAALFTERAILCCQRIDFGMQKFLVADWKNYSTEIFTFYVSGFIGALFYWYHNGFDRSEKEMTDIVFQLISQPPLKTTH